MARKEPRGPGRNRRLAGAAAALIVCAAATFALASTSPAHDDDRPTISGNPIVGETLTSSKVGDPGFYKWQRCDPALASCKDAPAGSSNWTHIPGASGQGVRTYTVAPADLGYFIRVLAKRSKWSWHYIASAPVGPVTAPPVTPPPEPPPEEAIVPQHGIQLAATPLAGIVKVKPPGQSGFIVLTDTTGIPVNSVIDTRGSEVQLTAATGAFANETRDDSVAFRGGLFRIMQPAATDSAAIAELLEKLACRSGSSAGAKASAAGHQAVTAGKRRRRLWGRGSGSYATSGGGGTGSVRGTTWLTKDTCKGTRFYVSEGVGITVLDFDLKKQIDLGPGENYFASLG